MKDDRRKQGSMKTERKKQTKKKGREGRKEGRKKAMTIDNNNNFL